MAQRDQHAGEQDSITEQIAEFMAKGNEIEVCKPQAPPRRRYLAKEAAFSTKKWERARPVTFVEYWKLHGVEFLIDQYALYYRLPDEAKLNFNNGMLYSVSYRNESRLPILSFEALDKIRRVLRNLEEDFAQEYHVFKLHMLDGMRHEDISENYGYTVYAVSTGVHKAIGYIGGNLREFFEPDRDM